MSEAAPTRGTKQHGLATRAVHVGQGPDPATGAVVQPIHLSTTFVQEAPGVTRQGYEYSRQGNPTRGALEECLASLEGATHGLSFASGLAATTTLLLLLQSGDHVVYMEDVYGGTFRLFDQVFRRFGVEFTAVDASDPTNVERAITPRTRMVWIETPTNPLLRIVDIAAVAEVAHAGHALVCVDNTFASPILQRPLEREADLVLHSATKYLGGHSDVIGGALLTNDDELAERLRFHQNAAGGVPSPFDCWLLLRGLKTLQLRVERQSDSAMVVARHLEQHSAVRQVYYPGLPQHPLHDVAKRQMAGRFGGVVSFEVANQATAFQVLSSLKIFALAESLGAVESLAEHPAVMTHASVPAEERARLGVDGGLIRLSVGVEDIEDLIDDLDQALSA